MKKLSDMTSHILIIDELYTQSQLYQQSLMAAGYAVTTAVNAKAAWVQLEKFCPDIVIMERSVPGMNAAELCQQIKTKYPAIFIYMLTDEKTEESDINAGFECGVDAYLFKPVREIELLTRIRVSASMLPIHHALEKQRQEYRLITENVTDLIGRVSFTGEFLYISPSCYKFLGCGPEEVVGEIVDHWLHPDDQSFIDEIPRILSGEASEATFEHRILHKNGSFKWVETNARVLENHDGKGELVFVARDISKRKEVESQLHLLSKALMAADQGVIITNRAGVVGWVNPAFTTLTGYSPEEIIGNTPRILKSNQHSPAFYAALWQTILAKETWHGELINRRKDGQEYVEEMTISPVTDGKEEITHFVAIKQDITATREAQEFLQQSERQYRTLVENLPDIILRCDSQYRFIYASENVVEVSGILAKDYVGKTHHEIDLSPEWADFWQNNLREVMQSKTAREGQYLHDGANGRFYFYWRLIPEFDNKGDVTGVLLIFQDTTERHQNEAFQKKQQAIARMTSSLRQAVTRSEMLPIILNELLSITEASVVALVTADLNTAEWVVEAISEGDHAYLIGTRLPFENPLTQRLFVEGKPYINNAILAEPGLSLRDKTGLPLRDKESLIQAVVGLPLSMHGNELGIIWIAHKQPILPEEFDLLTAVTDVAANALFRMVLFEETQHQALVLADRVRERTAALSLSNTQLNAAMRSRDLFLASMSHELRTPLSVILMRTEILQDEIYGALNDKQKRTLEISYESAQHLLSLIGDILDVAKIEAGQVTLEFEAVVIRDVCQASLYMVQALAQQKQINVTFEVTPEELCISADSRRLKQILVNLLTNAIKFTPEAGNVGLLVDMAPDDTIRFTVWDTGIGVREEDMPKMFNPFVQLDNSLSRKYAGTGLGLSLVLHLVELHGGGIQIESKINEGTHISFKLPATIRKEGVPPMSTRLPEITQKNLPHGKETTKVLLAEDNKLIADGLVDYFSTLDYELIVAQNGVEALEKTIQFRPHLILMDIHMPDMDGLEAIKRIRSNGSLTAGVPIVALTALAMPGDSERCLAAGATAYLPKPFSLAKLKAMVDDLLEKHKGIPLLRA
ncbi:MAG: PAS domain S-box protein [Chloroflexi bacterium]|nr:PAS domain S-box protein [Chloroflexota bacterium]